MTEPRCPIYLMPGMRCARPVGHDDSCRNTEDECEAACDFGGENHSSDLIQVFYGQPEPTILCGYHAMREGL